MKGYKLKPFLKACPRYLLLTFLFAAIILNFKVSLNSDVFTINFGLLTLHPLYFNEFNSVLFLSFIVLTFLVLLAAQERIKFLEYCAYFIYVSSGLTTLLAHDIISLIIALEIMAIGAILIIACGPDNILKKGAIIRYSCIHFLAGALMLSGFSAQLKLTGSIELVHHIINIKNISKNFFSNIPQLLIMSGLLINCSIIPLSSWVPDSYPKASNTGSIILLIFTTKVSAYILLLLFRGSDLLLFLGIGTSIYAVIFSIFENNLKRLLAYNLVGQMGLIVTAIGFYNEISLFSVILQIIFCSAYQCLLGIVVNIIIHITKRTNINELGALFKKMPLEAIYCLIGILTMGALPGTSSFIGKTLMIYNIHTEAHQIFERLFIICGLLLFISVGLKLFYFTFIHQHKYTTISIKKNTDIKTHIITAIISMICIFSGIFFYNYLKLDSIFPSNITIYKQQKIIFQFVSLICAILLFACCRNFFKGRISFKMDIDWLYRSLLHSILLKIYKFILSIRKIFDSIVLNSLYTLSNSTKSFAFITVKPLGFVIFTSVTLISIILIFICLNH